MTITPIAAVIQAAPTAAPQIGEESYATSAQNNNGVFIGGDGNLYTVVMQNDFITFQMKVSADQGATWSDIGAPTVGSIDSASPFCTVLAGSKIWLVWTYADAVGVQLFDISTGQWGDYYTWNSDDTIVSPQDGIYHVHLRPDGTLFIVAGCIDAGTGNASIFGIQFSPAATTFSVPVLISSEVSAIWQQYYEYSVMAADGTVTVFLAASGEASRFPSPQFTTQIIKPDNSLGSVDILPSGYQTGGASGVIGGGAVDGTKIYAAAGLSSASGGFGVLHFDGATWALSSALDSGAALPVYTSPQLFLQDGLLIAVYLAASTQPGGKIRIGYVSAVNYSIAANWTWATAYSLDSPDVPVSGMTAPYFPTSANGQTICTVMDTTGTLRIMGYLGNASDSYGDPPSVVLILAATAASLFGNEFR